MSNEPRNDMERVFGRPIARGIVERGTVAQPPITRADIVRLVQARIERPGDPDPFEVSVVSNQSKAFESNAFLVDVADPTGPNGQRTFVVDFSVHEV